MQKENVHCEQKLMETTFMNNKLKCILPPLKVIQNAGADVEQLLMILNPSRNATISTYLRKDLINLERQSEKLLNTPHESQSLIIDCSILFGSI